MAFIDLAQVDIVEEVSENAKMLVEDGGQICRVGEHLKQADIILLKMVEESTGTEIYYNDVKLEKINLSTYAGVNNYMLINEEIVRKAENGVLIMLLKNGTYTIINEYRFTDIENLKFIEFEDVADVFSIADKMPVM